MPEIRRKLRRREQRIPPKIQGLFEIGMARNHISNEEYARLWEQYGDTFRRMHPDDFASTWAYMELPEDQRG